jgi:undecaprenyl-diphosphatase
MLEILLAILLGIVQGLTEFLPISSSAHLIIVPWLLEPFTGIGDFGLSFDLALHLGTLVAVLSYFWQDWLRYIGAGVASVRERGLGGDNDCAHDRLLAWLLLIGCIPGALAGMFLDKHIESVFHAPNSPHQASAMLLIAFLMIIMAGALWLVDTFVRHFRPFAAIDLKDAILIGMAQALAVFPGVSRSGSTITVGLALGLTREAAARFSFLLGAPLIAGAGAKKLLDALQDGTLASQAGIFLAGFLAASITGYLCIKFLLHFLQSHTMMVFVWYRLLVAFMIIVLVAAGFGG